MNQNTPQSVASVAHPQGEDEEQRIIKENNKDLIRLIVNSIMEDPDTDMMAIVSPEYETSMRDQKTAI